LTAFNKARLCVATVTDEQYLTGTLVLLSSFLAHNPWFDGDIVVIHAGLSRAARDRLAAFPSMRFHTVSDALRDRLSALCMQVPHLASHAARFHSLDAFDLPYETILFLDSDVLCTGNAFDALQLEGELLAAPDLSYWQGRVRHVETFVALDERRWPNAGDTLPITFNAGVLVIRPALAGRTVHEDLLALLEPAAFARVRTGHTDQVVLNWYFRDRWTRLPDTLNVLLTPRPISVVRTEPPIEDAVFLHFLAQPKPWQVEAPASPPTTRRALGDARWHDAWSAFLASEFASAGEPRIT
jgi:lipopolysaccharide biosynthesis glycosyltransferase